MDGLVPPESCTTFRQMIFIKMLVIFTLKEGEYTKIYQSRGLAPIASHGIQNFFLIFLMEYRTFTLIFDGESLKEKKNDPHHRVIVNKIKASSGRFIISLLSRSA